MNGWLVAGILACVVSATPDDVAHPGLEAVSCLDGDETAFLQRLPNHELYFLGELVGVVPGDAVGAPPTWSGGTLAPTSVVFTGPFINFLLHNHSINIK